MKFIDIAHDPWHTVGGEDGPIPHPQPKDHLLLTLEQALVRRAHLSGA